jgi:hypothetical protein
MTGRAAGWVLAGSAVAAAVVVVGVPVWLIQPFAPQTPAAIEWSWRLRQVAPLVTAAAVFVAAAFAAWHWRAHPARPVSSPALWRRRAGLALVVAAASGAAWFARQNHFEWQFRPFPDPRFVSAAAATDVPADEPVLGVANARQALAFPITRLGYHHLVNTTLGEVPIVATY